MSRVSKLMLLLVLIVFVLACNVVSGPVRNVENLASTAESIASAMPIETLQAIPSVIPVNTLEALPSLVPGIGDMTNPKDPPLTEWNGVPIMPAATAGSESSKVYTFKATATVTEVFDYYKTELTKLGWTESFPTSSTGSGAILTYEKDSHILIITVSSAESGVSLVTLSYE